MQRIWSYDIKENGVQSTKTYSNTFTVAACCLNKVESFIVSL